VLEEEARVHDVVRLRVAPLADVRAPELDVREARLGRVGPRELELHLVHVDPDGPAGRADESGELHRDGAAAAAEVDARLPRADPHVGEEPLRVGPADPREQLKPVVPLASAADDVAGHGSGCYSQRTEPTAARSWMVLRLSRAPRIRVAGDICLKRKGAR
jgi:hypothetical protein